MARGDEGSGAEAGPPPPIFVLAAPGLPGPTLAAALGGGPATWGLPEINLPLVDTVDTFLREVTGPRTAQAHGLLRALSRLLAGEESGAGVDAARRWLLARAHLPTDAVFLDIAARVAPRRMVMPATSLLLDPGGIARLRALFPEAAFVHLAAHPFTYGRVASGTEEGRLASEILGAQDAETEPRIADPQELWLMIEDAASGALSDLPGKRRVRVDAAELVADPAGVLKGLARALGLPWRAGAVAGMTAPEAAPFAGPGPMGAHVTGRVESFADLARTFPEPGGDRLSGPLPWRPDAAPFRREIAERARELGYG